MAARWIEDGPNFWGGRESWIHSAGNLPGPFGEKAKNQANSQRMERCNTPIKPRRIDSVVAHAAFLPAIGTDRGDSKVQVEGSALLRRRVRAIDYDAPVYHGGEPLSIVRHNNQRFFASTCGRNASNPSTHPSESTSLASYLEIRSPLPKSASAHARRESAPVPPDFTRASETRQIRAQGRTPTRGITHPEDFQRKRRPDGTSTRTAHGWSL